MPQIFSEVRPREGGLDRQKDVRSPVDRLVDTVDLADVDLAECTCPSIGGVHNDESATV